MRQSIIYNYSVEEIKSFIDTSDTIQEVLQKIGFKSLNGSGCRQVFFNYVKDHNLSLDALKERTKNKKREHLQGLHKISSASYEECFCENSRIARHSVKEKIIKDSLIPYKCDLCGNTGNWNGQPLSLQLDHINGINNDNRLENLRFLCPNCHSQTETFSGKCLRGLKEEKEKRFDGLEKDRWQIIENSNIDFSKFGWVGELAELFGIAPNRAGQYVKTHYPDFYKNCFTRNRSLR